MTLRSRLLRLLRVPAEPSAPAGDEDVQVFRASPNYFRYRLVGWFLRTLAATWGLVLALGLSARYGQYLPSRIGPFPESTLMMMIGAIELAALAGVIVQATMSLLLTRLDFEQRWYVVSDRSLRTREGLVRMHEKTMTFANIQHVSIRQGPLQRMLGIADLQIRTAGGGAAAAVPTAGMRRNPGMTCTSRICADSAMQRTCAIRSANDCAAIAMRGSVIRTITGMHQPPSRNRPRRCHCWMRPAHSRPKRARSGAHTTHKEPQSPRLARPGGCCPR